MKDLNSVAKVLTQLKAKNNWLVKDDFGSTWLVKTDRDGYKLDGYKGEGKTNGACENATIPYWLTFCIELPGLHVCGAYGKPPAP